MDLMSDIELIIMHQFYVLLMLSGTTIRMSTHHVHDYFPLCGGERNFSFSVLVCKLQEQNSWSNWTNLN